MGIPKGFQLLIAQKIFIYSEQTYSYNFFEVQF